MSEFETPESEIAWLREQHARARSEKDEALDLVNQMREHVQDSDDSIDRWIDVFDMVLDDRGVWIFDRQASLFNEHQTVLSEHRKIVADWNKFVPRYNATVAPKDAGRPVQASEAQVAQVMKLRKAGHDLRSVAKETGLTVRTVRTVIDNSAGKGRAAQRKNELRRKEFGRMRAAAFRAKKRKFESLPKEISRLQKTRNELGKAARGLAKHST